MAVHLTGFLLALIIVLHIWIILTMLRQKLSSVISTIYVYLNILVIIVDLCLLFYLSGSFDQLLLTIFKIQFVAEIFVPPILVYLYQSYSSEIKAPAITLKSALFFIVSVILSILSFANLMFTSGIEQQGIVYPRFSNFYWLAIGYFYFTFGFILVELLQKYQLEKRQAEIDNIKYILTRLLPLTLIGFTFLKLIPLWAYYHPALFLSHFLFSLVILSLAFKFRLIEIDDSVYRSISFFGITALFLALFSLLIKDHQINLYFLSIPVVLALLFIFQLMDLFTHRKINEQIHHREYDLEDELEVLISETEKYIDDQALAQFIGDLSLKVLHCTKCAVITSRFDVKPYQVTYLNGFEKEQLENLLSLSNSPFIETLEYNRVILNRFDLSSESALFQLLDKYHIYLVIPMSTQANLQGFILLGGDRKSFQVTKQDLKFARFLSIKASHSFQNIQEIQKMVQSQKMADLGLLASQLAHDFQSFITLVKLETRENTQLKQHANYMEKLVKDLLHYARPKELRFSLININNLIDMTLDLIKIPPQISVEKHYSGSIPQISVDVDQMQRVFLNLFENSISAFKENKGRIKISTRPLRPLSNFRRNTWLYIEILDDGVGIPEEFLEKIFDPFFTTRKREGGSGMGLAIVRQIITGHRGFIDVTSKLGKGTIFNIRLPYLR